MSRIAYLRTSREIIKRLEANGFILVAVKGSHHQFKKAGSPTRVTVPHPNRDVSLNTVFSIERQSGVSMRK
jgi:predicted RNA binding protein YcfA (HicA-like mRNA interferase family)